MPLRLTLYTDFVCPFCFIAEESTVPQLMEQFDLELEWHGFELHPETPLGGKPLSELFPGVHLPSLHRQTKDFAARFGVSSFQPPDRLRNSKRSLALAEYARDQSALAELRRAIFSAHWREGKNIEDETDLRAIAVSVGLNADAALAASGSAPYLERVTNKQLEARRSGVSGVPTFDFGTERIVGCQPYDLLADAARRAGATKR